jgi:hypothetical protein
MGAMTGSGLDLMAWWARALWVVLYAWVVSSHLIHVSFMRRQPRAWHLTHVLMATGMMYMFAPWRGDPLPMRFWQLGFEIAAVAIAGFVLVQWARGHAVNLLWFVQLLGMAAMGFMFSLDGHAPPGARWITYALIAFYVLEAAGWSRRTFAEADEQRISWVPFSLHPRPAGAVCASRLCGHVPVELAASGTVMGLGMVWMFTAMDPDAAAFVARATSAGHPGATATGLLGLIAILLLVTPRPTNRRAALTT